MPQTTTTAEPQEYARAVLNILDDLSVEGERLRDNQVAILNILDDFSRDKSRLQNTEAAVLNILDDFTSDTVWLKRNQAAMLNILEDFDGEKKKVETANEELQQFAYIASHDLREPLRMISSYLQLLERRYKGQLDDDADDFINFAVDGARRLQLMINGLLAYSRLRSQRHQFRMVDATALIQEALSNLAMEISETDALVQSGPLSVIEVDPQQMIQVFQNLIANAIKFRRKGVRSEIHISVEEAGHEDIFTVSDNGAGIEPQYKDQIFAMFRRLHGTDVPGAGMGLAICKRVVERHGGRIWLDSQPGSGSAFHFTIPVRKERTHDATDSQTSGQSN